MGDMDSGNSGSLQSSSGGDDDYESSRGGTAPDSLSSLFNHNHNHQSNYPPAAHVSNSLNPPEAALFDPLASYLDHLSRSSNLDQVWPKDSILRPDLLNLPSSSVPAPADAKTNQNSGVGGVKNPKKRTRASRKAPTTVLTTDTTNFRAMVQEFTGIPAPPFGGASTSPLFFPRTRLDLFGARMDAPPPTNPSPYLLRPLAQKIAIPLPTPVVSSITPTNKDVMTASSSGAGNYQIPDLGLFATDVPTNLSFGSGGSLELPITTTPTNDDVRDELAGITASFFPTADGGKGDGGGPFGFGAPTPSTSSGLDGSRQSHHHSHNVGFSDQ